MAQRQDGNAEFRTTLLNAAALAGEHGDTDRLAAAALANSRGYTSEVGMVDDERVAVLRSAVGALPDGDPRQIRLRSMLAMEIHYGGSMEERRELSDRALADARGLGEPATLAHVMIDRWFALWTTSTIDERDQLRAEIESIAAGVGDPLIDYWLVLLDSHLGHDTGNRERLVHALARCEELSDSVGEPFLLWLTMWVQGSWAVAEGRLDEAEEMIEKGVAYGMENDQGDAMIIYAAQASCLRREQGRMDEVVDVLVASVEDNPRIPGFAALLCQAYLESGERAEAAQVLASVLEGGLANWPVELTWGTGMCLMAEVSARLESAEGAAAAYELLEPHGHRSAWNGAMELGSINHYLGMAAATLGRPDEARERFAAAETANEALGVPLITARTRIEWARCLLTSGGDAVRARELLGQALDVARELGSPSTERQAAELLGYADSAASPSSTEVTGS